MQFMLSILTNEESEPQMGTPEGEKYMAGYFAFTTEVQEAGVFVSGNALQPVATGGTVAVRGGKMEVVDGPFAETKEQLGGYYILDCKDLEEAMGYAAKIPGAAYGRIEVRPVVVFD